MQDLDDQSLVARCIYGDKVAWDKFVERFSQLILWAIKERLRRANFRHTQQDIEDIFQNVFILLWEKEKLQQIRNRENVSGWLVMVAANCAVNYCRNKREGTFRKEFSLEKVHSSDCSAGEVIDQQKLHSILERIFSCLPVRERIILKLNYFYDKTHLDIGKILKMPANTVSSIIKRTKEKLGAELKRQGWENF